MLDFDNIDADKILTRYDINTESSDKPGSIVARLLPKDPALKKVAEDIVYARIDLINDDVRAALKSKAPEIVLQEGLLRGIEAISELYGRGIYNLSQVIVAADTFDEGLSTVEAAMSTEKKTKGTAVMHAAEGDPHDIGKNIAAVLLKSNGFKVIDLGRDVPVDAVVDSVLKNKPNFVTGTALMTTTMSAFPKITAKLAENDIHIPFLCAGGAVNREFVESFDMGVYVASAKEGPRLAAKIVDGWSWHRLREKWDDIIAGKNGGGSHNTKNKDDEPQMSKGIELDIDMTDEEKRGVRARILYDGKARKTFIAGARNIIRCWIGLPDDDQAATANGTIPRVEIPPEGLLFTAELCWGEQYDSKPLHLPAVRTARSGDCDLNIDVPANERYVSADIVFRYRGRIFEAVKVEAAALAPGETEGPRDELRLRVQYNRRQVIALDDAEPCTATLVFEDTAVSGGTEPARLAGSQPTMRVYDGKGGRKYALKFPVTAVQGLNALLHIVEKSLARRHDTTPRAEATLDPDDEEVRILLRDMARVGAGLYNQLELQGFADPGERIQFISLDADTILPLELVYDRGYPMDAAHLCAGWKEALTTDTDACAVCGAMTPDADMRRHASTICPLGFWSLRKIIERMDPTSAAGTSAPRADRRSLPPIDSAVFATHKNVPTEESQATFAAIQDRIADTTYAHHWDEWYEAVKRHPCLLIALPHHDQGIAEDFLEIGDATLLGPDKARLGRGQILPGYVNPDTHEPGPILLLLGCRTADESELGYVQIVREFQKLRTSIVLGTLAQILGRNAAPLARELVEQLVAVDDAHADFGTLMRRVRRRMLAQGFLLSLCLIALGDAEWRLTPRAPKEAPAPVP